MRRILALLLAVACLMTAAASAESRRIVFDAEADGTLLEEYLTAIGVENAEALGPGLAGLLNSLRLEGCVSREEGETLVSGRVTAEDETLFDLLMRLSEADGKLAMASSLWPGYAMTAAYETAGPESTATAAAGTEDRQQQMDRLEQAVRTKAAQWWEKQDCAWTNGDFAGDAYDGGTICGTATLKDSDLYVLIRYLEPEIRGAVGLAGLEDTAADSFFKTLTDLTVENGGQYLVRVVYDSGMTLKGISVTCLRDGTQVATLSLGLEPDALRFVAGFGGPDNRVWFLDGDLTPQDRGFRGEIRVWQDPQKLGFQAAKAAERNLRLTLTLEGAYTEREDGGDARLAAVLAVPGKPVLRETVDISSSGGGFSFLDSFWLSDHPQPVLTLKCSVEETTETPVWPEGLKPVETAESDSGFEQAVTEQAQNLAVNLLRIVPPELLVYLMRLTPDFPGQ